jgi:hypothetical protein
MIPRAIFEDDRLSLDTRGLLGYLLVKPDDWQVWNTDLERTGHMGESKLTRILRELKQFGYMTRHQEHDERGRIVWITIIHESPVITPEPYPDYPGMGEPGMDQPSMENQGIYKELTSPNTNSTKNERESAPAQRTSTPDEDDLFNAPRVTAVSNTPVTAYPPGTNIKLRRDLPPVRPMPKASDDPAIAALLDTLRPIYPFRGGKVAKPILAKRALAGLSLPEREQIKIAARNYAASSDGQEGYAKDLHTWIDTEEWREYLTPATARPVKPLTHPGPAPRPYTVITKGA